MNCWQLLDIEPSVDTRAIKRAYAQKLKVTQPDVHPEAFKELHHAYKTALSYANHGQARLQELQSDQGILAQEEDSTSNTTEIDTPLTTESETQSSSSDALDEDQPLAVVNEIDNDEEVTESANEVHPYQIEGERLVAKVQQLLNTRYEMHNVTQWHFLSESPFILDDAFNWQLGLAIMHALIEQEKSHKKSNYRMIGSNVMTYLDSLFNWQGNRNSLYRSFQPEDCEKLLNKIVENEPTQTASAGLRGAKSVKWVFENRQPITNYYFANSGNRGIACIIDLIAITLVSVPINKGIDALLDFFDLPHSSMIAPIIFILLFLVVNWLSEASKYQSTIGKMIFGFAVTDENYRRLSLSQSLLRSSAFTVIYLWAVIGLFFIPGNGDGQSLFASITLPWILLSMLINSRLGDRMMHDRVSKTFVFDMRKTRKEHNRKHKKQ